jgi:hypothetical protein
MSDNQYENFKHGVKRDIQGAALGFFAGVGLLLLIFTIGGTLIWFFLNVNDYSVATKTVVSVFNLLLVISMLANRQVGNFILLSWLKLLLIIFCLVCISFLGLILYWMYVSMKGSF